MNPLLWWWRWWSRVISPNREEPVVNAQEVIDEQQAKADRLSSELEAREAEIAALRERLAQSDSKVEDLRARLGQAERAAPQHAAPPPQAVPDGAPAERQMEPDGAAADAPAPEAPGPPDVSTATEVLGTRVKLNDLTVIEGIGPKIAELLSNAGYSTWQALSEADTTELRRVLQDAGPRYRIHDPSRWPPQAALLARGQWQEYKDLTSKLRQRSS